MTDELHLSLGRRLRHYLAGVESHGRQARFVVPAETKGALLRHDSTVDDFMVALQRWTRGRQYLTAPRDRVEWVFGIYVAPILATCAGAGLAGRFIVRPGDSRDTFTIPTIAKSRQIADLAGSVLFPLNSGRHFRPMGDVAAADIPFRQKAARIVWRGATTGSFITRGTPTSRLHVMKWVDRNPRIDVGYSEVVAKLGALFRKPARAALRPKLSIGEQLRSRYLLSLEGNDVASGLKWMLLSNSAVLMPPPTAESWFCEALLVPWVHYVPVAPDLSDLAETLDWCEANMAAVEEIVATSTKFAMSFMHPPHEKRLRRKVMEAYFGRFTLVDEGEAEAAIIAA